MYSAFPKDTPLSLKWVERRTLKLKACDPPYYKLWRLLQQYICTNKQQQPTLVFMMFVMCYWHEQDIFSSAHTLLFPVTWTCEDPFIRRRQPMDTLGGQNFHGRFPKSWSCEVPVSSVLVCGSDHIIYNEGQSQALWVTSVLGTSHCGSRLKKFDHNGKAPGFKTRE